MNIFKVKSDCYLHSVFENLHCIFHRFYYWLRDQLHDITNEDFENLLLIRFAFFLENISILIDKWSTRLFVVFLSFRHYKNIKLFKQLRTVLAQQASTPYKPNVKNDQLWNSES